MKYIALIFLLLAVNVWADASNELFDYQHQKVAQKTLEDKIKIQKKQQQKIETYKNTTRQEADSNKSLEHILLSFEPVEKPRFGRYGMNYLAFSSPHIKNSDVSLEGQVSMRYNFLESGSFYFYFTNRFDFYLERRDSSPVVIRDERPGFAFDFTRMVEGRKILGLDSLALKLEHWSNGQTIHVNSSSAVQGITQEQYQEAYQNYNKNGKDYDKDRDTVDSLSRSMNFVSISGLKSFAGKHFASAQMKFRVSRDDAVFVQGFEDANFNDYDRVSLGYAWKSPYGLLITQMRAGNKLLATASYDLAYRLDCNAFPLMIKYHHGPFQRLSDYSRRINAISVGVAFTY